MASFDQLQMLNDGEATTSSSNKSYDEEEDDIGDSSLAANDDDDNSPRVWNDSDGGSDVKKSTSIENAVSPVAATSIENAVSPVAARPKKRIKLSLGTLKMVKSSPKQKRKEQETHDNDGKGEESPKESAKPAQGVSGVAAAESATISRESKKLDSTEAGNRNQNSIPTPTKSRTSLEKESPRTSTSKTDIKNATATKIPAKNGKMDPGTQEPEEAKRRHSVIAGENTVSPAKKRISLRSIRITPMSSPGLLLPPGSNIRGVGTTNNLDDSSTVSSPNCAFNKAMIVAGYTKETRTKNPHRGSSMQRIVDDMFDSNTKFCLRFPKLVPENLISKPTLPPKEQSKTPPTENTAIPPYSSSDTPIASKVTSETSLSTKDPASKVKLSTDLGVENIDLKTMPILMKRLTKALKMDNKSSNSVSALRSSVIRETKSSVELLAAEADVVATSTKHRSRIPKYSDIAPLNLTLALPDEYIQEQLKYALIVDEREKAIINFQENCESFQNALEAKARKSSDLIPPLPRPTDVPIRASLRSITNSEEKFGSEDQQNRSHPLYQPKNQQMVDHLDKRCFHVTNGRYFGLNSNTIADPYFFGPNAPGIGGLNLSASTGLATASTGGGAMSLGVPLFVAPAQPSSATSTKSPFN